MTAGFDPGRVTTVTFDSYSTLVDVGTTIGALADHVAEPVVVGRQWRVRSLMYTLIANHLDAYQPFYEMNRDALKYALADNGEDLSRETREELLATYHDLDSFPDVRPGIERLVDGDYDCYVISNGDPEMLESMVEGADIADLLSDTISADEIETYKPAAELYHHAAERTGTPIEEVVHVTAGFFDTWGAMHAGMQGVWLNRHDRPADPFGPDPDLVAPDIEAFASDLGV